MTSLEFFRFYDRQQETRGVNKMLTNKHDL